MPRTNITAIKQKDVASFLSPRPPQSHKGQFGTVTVLGGNQGMIGAALLAGRAALKLGTGIVHVGLLAENAPSVDLHQPELMLHNAQEAILKIKPDVIAIGCGLGTDLKAQKLLHDALKSEVKLVIDADALNILAMRPDLRSMLSSRKGDAIITPHPGEAAHLLGTTTELIQADREKAAKELATRLSCHVVLKGAGSLCVNTSGNCWINNTGNPGMSTPGMGDVLSGMIAAQMAQGLPTEQAMLLCVHLHGAAGDALAAQQANIGMTASEVTEWSRWLLNQWLRK